VILSLSKWQRERKKHNSHKTSKYNKNVDIFPFIQAWRSLSISVTSLTIHFTLICSLTTFLVQLKFILYLVSTICWTKDAVGFLALTIFLCYSLRNTTFIFLFVFLICILILWSLTEILCFAFLSVCQISLFVSKIVFRSCCFIILVMKFMLPFMYGT